MSRFEARGYWPRKALSEICLGRGSASGGYYIGASPTY